MIQFHQVKKEYPGNDFALGEVSFVVDEGEFVFLIGPSGSGKTTLIKLLIREENPTSGKIFLDDYDITKLSRSNVYKLRRQIGVIFQDYKLIPDKNAYENVAFAMEAAGRSTKDIKETVPYVLDIVGLKHRMSAFPEQLSGGEKQRVAIARAVANNPRVLIADEPTGNLDPGAAWDIVQILSKINNWGTTVIMSTHGSDIVNTLNKRVIQMRDGVVVRDDKKGGYEKLGKAEQSDQIDVSKSEDLASLYAKDEKKGPIQVKIKPKNEEAPEARKSFMSWFKFGKNPEQLEAKPLVLQKQDMTSGLQQEAAEAAAELGDQDIDAATAQEIIADADNTSVAELDLRPEVVADLQVAGYNDVEDVISAGPEQLADELIIDPEEVVLVAKAVSEFVEEEEEKIEEHERKPKANKSDKDEKKSKSEKVKIDLTGKK